MKIIKNLTVTISYEVTITNVLASEEEYEQLCKMYDNNIETRDLSSSKKAEYINAIHWLSEINEREPYYRDYEITEFE